MGSRECHSNGPAKAANNCWEYHINGPAELVKSVATVAFNQCCNVDIKETVDDPFELVKGSTAAFDKCCDAFEREYVLLLKKNLYRLKSASIFCKGSLPSAPKNSESAQYPVKGVTSRGRPPHLRRGKPPLLTPTKGITSRGNQPAIQEFKHACKDIIVLCYVDDCIILSRDKITIEKFVESLKHGPKNFDFTDEGDLSKYLGIDVKKIAF